MAVLCLKLTQADIALVSRTSFKITIFKAGRAPSSQEHPGQRFPSKWLLFRTVVLLTLGLSVVIAVVLTAFVIAWVLSIPLIITALYSLGRSWWRKSLALRKTIR